MSLLRTRDRPVTAREGIPPLLFLLAGISLAVSPGCTHPAPVVARAPAGVVCDYSVEVGADLDLHVTATFAAPIQGELAVDDPAMPFVDTVTLVSAAGRTPVPQGKSGFALACTASCRVEYRFRLREAATHIADVDTAIALGNGIVAPPSTWLLRPWDASAGRYRFRVQTSAGIGFASGVRASPAVPGAYEGDLANVEESAFSVFGGLKVLPVASGVAAAVVGGAKVDDGAVTTWLGRELTAIGDYYGRAPDDRLVIIVAPGTSEVIRGKTLGGGGASMLVRLGTGTTPNGLADDWVVAHELVHVGFPSLGHEHGWFAEGLATYVEPVARARLGLVPVEQIWSDLVDGLPQGIPAKSDQGLEGSEEWGRVYWGGALYFLLADLTIRDETKGRASLDDAIRAVAATGANVETRWPLEQVLAVGDRATGTHVLHDLYVRFGTAPGTADLDALWSRLGVRKRAGAKSVELDDTAPWASFRKAITAANPAGGPTRTKSAAE
ncbi:MAG TPA: hypothetical protein VH062_03970 [Polyangiaceae bacterium]|nr:hypothetical protein [Polyangiaceae bacterium]